jgi:hypothetical protein
MRIDGDHNIEHKGKVAMVLQAAWSRRRAWHGERVTMEVRSELIKDGTTLKLYVLQASNNKPIDRVAPTSLTASRYDHDYPNDGWKALAYGENREFLIEAIAAIDSQKQVSAKSPPLRIDLDPPTFSA